MRREIDDVGMADRTRDRILHLLKTKGPSDSSRMAIRLEVTPTAVRQHLQKLEAEGVVRAEDEARGVGRPTRVWSLADGAAAHFPDNHAELTLDLIDAVRSAFGARGMERLIAARTRAQLESYRLRVPGADQPLSKRVAALARIRTGEGYMAESRSTKGGVLLVENHCPICVAAKACSGLCAEELRLFQEVLGEGVTVERTEHLLDGARRCVYKFVGG